NATVEAWVTWHGGAAYQRIFDFGKGTGAEGTQQASGGTTATADGYVFLTPTNGSNLRFAFKAPSANEVGITATALTVGAKTHVAVVFDDTNNLIHLYVNGAEVGGTGVAWTGTLS